LDNLVIRTEAETSLSEESNPSLNQNPGNNRIFKVISGLPIAHTTSLIESTTKRWKTELGVNYEEIGLGHDDLYGQADDVLIYNANDGRGGYYSTTTDKVHINTTGGFDIRYIHNDSSTIATLAHELSHQRVSLSESEYQDTYFGNAKLMG
jgi:hypothetical protein